MGCDIHPYAEVKIDGRWTPIDKEMPDGRDYIGFSILAGVRNGYGFAGCDTGNPVEPIAEPRGLPDDTSIIELEPYDENGVWLGDHSWSWVTLAELLALDLGAPITQRGLVASDVAPLIRRTGRQPASWCGGTTNKTWEQVEWTLPLCLASYLIPRLITALLWAGNYDPADVRVVFGFDS